MRSEPASPLPGNTGHLPEARGYGGDALGGKWESMYGRLRCSYLCYTPSSTDPSCSSARSLIRISPSTHT
jgi:hypothetical protein